MVKIKNFRSAQAAYIHELLLRIKKRIPSKVVKCRGSYELQVEERFEKTAREFVKNAKKNHPEIFRHL